MRDKDIECGGVCYQTLSGLNWTVPSCCEYVRDTLPTLIGEVQNIEERRRTEPRTGDFCSEIHSGHFAERSLNMQEAASAKDTAPPYSCLPNGRN